VESPAGASAAALIEKVGLVSKRVGGREIPLERELHRQAGGAAAPGVTIPPLDLTRERVRRLDVSLEHEIRIIGE
jgi:hypothetical protein